MTNSISVHERAQGDEKYCCPHQELNPFVLHWREWFSKKWNMNAWTSMKWCSCTELVTTLNSVLREHARLQLQTDSRNRASVISPSYGLFFWHPKRTSRSRNLESSPLSVCLSVFHSFIPSGLSLSQPTPSASIHRSLSHRPPRRGVSDSPLFLTLLMGSPISLKTTEGGWGEQKELPGRIRNSLEVH